MNWPYRNTVLLLCTVAFFITMAARVVISPLIPPVTEEYQISNTIIGVGLTGMWMSYSLSQFPSGLLAYKFGERRVILVSVGGTSLLLIFLATASLFVLFILGMVLLGAFAGLHYSVATALLTRMYENIGTAVGVHNGGAPAAGLLVPLIAVWIESRFGWKVAVGTFGLVGIFVFGLFAWRIRPTPSHPDHHQTGGGMKLLTLTKILLRPSILFTLILAAACTFVWQGISSFLPTFLVEYRGHSGNLAGLFFSLYFVTQGIMQVFVGRFADIFGRDIILASCMGSAVLGAILLILGPGLLAIGLAVVILGYGMSFAAAIIPRFIDNLSPKEQSTGIGLVRTVYGIFGSFGSVTVAYLADNSSWVTAFSFLALMMLLIFGILIANRSFSLGY